MAHANVAQQVQVQVSVDQYYNGLPIISALCYGTYLFSPLYLHCVLNVASHGSGSGWPAFQWPVQLRKPRAVVCSKATLSALAGLRRSAAIPYAKTVDQLHAMINGLKAGAEIDLLKYKHHTPLSLHTTITWPTRPLPIESFGTDQFPHIIFVCDEEKSGTKVGHLLRACGMRAVQRREYCHRHNNNIIETWRDSRLSIAVAKVTDLMKLSCGPWNTHQHKGTKEEMYASVLQRYSPLDSEFRRYHEDMCFDWGEDPRFLCHEAAFDRFSAIAASAGTDGGVARHTRWLTFLDKYPSYDVGWSSDLFTFEHYFSVKGIRVQEGGEVDRDSTTLLERAYRYLMQKDLQVFARMAVEVGAPLKRDFLKCIKDSLCEDTGFQYKLDLSNGSWRRVACEALQIMSDPGKLKRFNFDEDDKTTVESQRFFARRLFELCSSTSSITTWSWGIESYCFPNAFIRILSQDPDEANEAATWAQQVFLALCNAERHIAAQGPVAAKLEQILRDIAVTDDQSTLICFQAGYACSWDVTDPTWRDHAFAVTSGHPETKRCLEDHFRHLRLQQTLQQNGGIMRTWKLLRENIMGPSMTALPERNHVTAERTVGMEMRSGSVDDDDTLTAAKLTGKTKDQIPEDLLTTAVRALHEKRVAVTGTPASRRALAGTWALVLTEGNDFKPMLSSWMGVLCQVGCCLFRRDKNEAYMCIGTYTHATSLWQLEFLGANSTTWYFCPAKQSEKNQSFHVISDDAIWAGLPLEIQPAATLPAELKGRGNLLVGNRKDVQPLIPHCLAVADLSRITIDIWKNCCTHVGGAPIPNVKGHKDKNAYVQATFRALGHDDAYLEEVCAKLNLDHYHEELAADELDEELRDALDNDDGKKDFKDLWVRVNKRKAEQTAEEAVKAWQAEHGLGGGDKTEKKGKGVGGCAESEKTLPAMMPTLMPPPPRGLASPSAVEFVPGDVDVGDKALLSDVGAVDAKSKASTAGGSRNVRTPAHLRTLLPKDESGYVLKGCGCWETHAFRRYTVAYPDARAVCKKIGYPIQSTFSAGHGGRTGRTRAQALRDAKALVATLNNYLVEFRLSDMYVILILLLWTFLPRFKLVTRTSAQDLSQSTVSASDLTFRRSLFVGSFTSVCLVFC